MTLHSRDLIIYDMSDIRKKSGKKGVSYQLRHVSPDGYRYKTFARRVDAVHFAKSCESIYDYGAPPGSDITVFDVMGRWLETVKTVGRHGREPVGAATWRKYKERANNHILPLIGDLKLSDFTALLAVEFRRLLLEKCGRPTAKKCITDLKGALSEARLRGEITHDPLSDIKIVNSSRASERPNIPTRAQMRAVEAVLFSKRDQRDWSRMVAFFMTLRWTGCRPSEVRALPDSDILWERCQIRTSQGADEDGTIGDPKTVSGHRVISVPPIVMDVLADWIMIRGAEGPLVFPTDSGRPISHANVTRAWAKVRTEAGLDDEFGLYSLRHYRISERLADGANINLVSEEAGHSNARFTLSVYGHVMKEGLG